VPALILQGDALHVPLPDDSVDLICTSPPYWALRSYRDGEEHFDGQLGSEPDPFAFLDALLCATAEMVRVLKPSGSLWVNLGDKYAERTGPPRDGFWKGNQDHRTYRQAPRPRRLKTQGIRPKSLIGLPWRYALACIDELGLILRAEVIWSKPNGLPESVTDRVRRSHEHLFHFTKGPTYYSALDEVREPHQPQSIARSGRQYNAPDKFSLSTPNTLNPEQFCNPLGKLPGSVWSIPSEPLMIPDYFVEDALGWRMANRKELWHYAWHQVVRAGDGRPIMVREIDHFAAFPQELPRRIVLGWSPPAICTACGQGRFPVTARAIDDTKTRRRGMTGTQGDAGARIRHHAEGSTLDAAKSYSITGYACACTPRGPKSKPRGKSWHNHDQTAVEGRGYTPAALEAKRAQRAGLPPVESPYVLDGWDPPPTRPALVLDPFGGTATTAGVASVLGRIGISLDLSLDYCRLARWRVERSGHFAKTIERTHRENQGSLL
jgi:DNA modification methylase